MNPRAALTTYSLSRGAPSASLGTSPNCPTQSLWFISLPEAFYIISRCFSFVKNFFDFFKIFFILNKRREWDSNPRALADKRFSRPPRYDHFDISPYSLFSVFCASLSAQDIFYHRTSHMSTPKFTFFYIFSKKFLQHQDLLVL